MEVLNDAELLENVRKRYMQDLIMTYVGPTLLVVNPFKRMPQNISEETRVKYIKHIVSAKGNALAYKELPPHVYAISSFLLRPIYFLGKPIEVYLKTTNHRPSLFQENQELEKLKTQNSACLF